MPTDPFVRPAQRREVREARGLRRAIHLCLAVSQHRRSGDALRRCAGGERRDHFLALAAHHDIDAELAQRRAGRCRTVRPDRDGRSAAPVERGEHRARHAQLGRRATPEQVARRRRDHRHVGPERRDLARDIRHLLPEQMAVKHENGVAVPLQQRTRVAEFQRQMRRAAAEIDAVRKTPGRVDQCDPHCAASTRSSVPRSAPNQSASSASPLRQSRAGRNPSAARARRVSATK